MAGPWVQLHICGKESGSDHVVNVNAQLDQRVLAARYSAHYAACSRSNANCDLEDRNSEDGNCNSAKLYFGYLNDFGLPGSY